MLKKQLKAIGEENYKQTADIMINMLDNYEVVEPNIENQFAFHIDDMRTAATGAW